MDFSSCVSSSHSLLVNVTVNSLGETAQIAEPVRCSILTPHAAKSQSEATNALHYTSLPLHDQESITVFDNEGKATST